MSFILYIFDFCYKCDRKKEKKKCIIQSYPYVNIENYLLDNDIACSICLDEYRSMEDISILDCSHTFHHKCIQLWCKKQNTCPLCRGYISYQLFTP